MKHQMQGQRVSHPSAIGLALAIGMTVLLGACSETELVLHAAKHIGGNGPEPVYKVGSPYQIEGIWYHPAEDDSYVETGVASWYGAKFHNRATANGELYNMNLVTGAHRTLPLPSMVRVTNLENGRSIKVRVNDRGPFARGRIIDMSRRGAELLSFRDKGTAKVRVEILPEESRRLVAAIKGGVPATPPAEPVVVASAQTDMPLPSKPVEPVVTTEAVAPTQMFIQAGAFSQYENATSVSTRLGQIGQTNVTPVTSGERELYRVRLGPLASVEEADAKLDAVVKAGYPEAQLIVD